MRTIVSGFVVLIALILLLPAARAEEETSTARVPLLQGGRDLAANPDFEAGVDNAPDGWHIGAAPGGMDVAWGAHGLGGSKGLLLKAPEDATGQVGSTSVYQILDAAEGAFESDKQITVTAWVRLTGFEGKCFLWARCDAEGGPERRKGAFENSIMAGYEATGTSLWSPMIVRVVPSNATKRVYVGLVIGGRGAVQVDAFSARVKVESAAPTKPDPVGPGLYRAEGRYRALVREDAASMRVHIPVPILWREQVPLDFRAWTEPAGHLGSVKLVRRSHGYHYAEIQLVDLKKDVGFSFFWEGHVLALPHSPTPIPAGVELPVADVPDDVKPWLASTWCADATDERVRALAEEIRSVGTTADVVVPATLTRMRTVFRSATGHVDALTATEALTKRGSCTSCANLGAALLRAHGIPARIIAGYPTWSGPLQTHYVVEYWLAKDGWRLLESTRCVDDRPSFEQIEVAQVLPEDEAEPVAGPRASAAPGVPHLSLTEYPDHTRASPPPARLLGNMPDKPACDHRAVKVAVFDASSEAWETTARRMAERWRRLTNAAVEDEKAVPGLAPADGVREAKSLEALVEALGVE